MNNNAPDPKVLLNQILESIDYEGDKNAYIERFLLNIYTESFLKLVKELPLEQQEELNHQILSCGQDQSKILAVITVYFSQERLDATIAETSRDMMIGFIQAVQPSLTDEQKQRLSSVFQSYNNYQFPRQ